MSVYTVSCTDTLITVYNKSLCMNQKISSNDEDPIHASGGTLTDVCDSRVLVFNRQDAYYTIPEEELTVPTSEGDFVFQRDPQDMHGFEVEDIQSFRVGPLFHLPDDEEMSSDDEMAQMIRDYTAVIIAGFTLTNGDVEFVHYVLDSIEK